MPSPFPGMDPYLERPGVWAEFHGEFIYKIRKFVAAVLPEGYVAHVDRHVFVTDDEDEVPRKHRPDSFVSRDDACIYLCQGGQAGAPGSGSASRMPRHSMRS